MIGTRPLRILVVDDDPAMVGAITALVGTEGHQVITAYDGLTAVKRFREERPDLVLLDLAMPGPDGFTVIGQLRASGNVPVLVVSGESAEAAKVKALGIGADDYLVKPFGKQELLARISAVMRRVDLAGTGRVGSGDGAPGVLSAGSLTLEPARHEARVGAISLGLTPTEFRLLEALVRAGGDLVPHHRLARAGLARRARSRPAVAQAAPGPAALQAGGRRRPPDRGGPLRGLPHRGRRARVGPPVHRRSTGPASVPEPGPVRVRVGRTGLPPPGSRRPPRPASAPASATRHRVISRLSTRSSPSIRAGHPGPLGPLRSHPGPLTPVSVDPARDPTRTRPPANRNGPGGVPGAVSLWCRREPSRRGASAGGAPRRVVRAVRAGNAAAAGIAAGDRREVEPGRAAVRGRLEPAAAGGAGDGAALGARTSPGCRWCRRRGRSLELVLPVGGGPAWSRKG